MSAASAGHDLAEIVAAIVARVARLERLAALQAREHLDVIPAAESDEMRAILAMLDETIGGEA